MKILITGSEGFIGKHLVNLLKEKHEIYGFDRNENKDLNILGDIAEAFIEFKPYIVIHLASNISNDINECRDDVIALLNLLAFCKEFEVKKFIFTSSAAVYGDSYPKIIPINPYGIAKLQCEQWCEYYAKEYGINIIIMRLGNVYGVNGKGVINQFITQLKNNQPLTIFGDGKQLRNYVYIDSIIDIVNRYVEFKEWANFEVFDVATQEVHSLFDILYNINNIIKKPIEINFLPKQKEIENSNIIGYNCKIKLQEGIEKLWNEM